MNIRRNKRRKVVKSTKDAEQMAKDKLFQMSYLCDDQYIDHSHFLDTEKGHTNVTITPQSKIPASIKQLIDKYHIKTQQVKPDYNKRQRIGGLLARQCAIRNKTQLCICNAIESNYVFVGSKSLSKEDTAKPFRPQKASFLLIDPKRRFSTEEMPNCINYLGDEPMIKVTAQASKKHQSQLYKPSSLSKIRDCNRLNPKDKNKKIFLSSFT